MKLLFLGFLILGLAFTKISDINTEISKLVDALENQ